MAIILGPSCVREEAPASSEEPSETEKPAVNEGTVIFYSATVSDADATRATLDSDKHYIFETGDQLVLTGTNISGTLTLKTGAGENNATFDGNLTYTGEGSPAPDLELKAYLKSTSDAMTSMSYDSAEYPTSAITATTAEAVQKYSHFTGTSTFAAKSFTVSQQSTFLNFIMTFEDATKAGDVLDININSGTGTMRTGSTTATLSGSDVMVLFVAVVPAGTELDNDTGQVGGKTLPFGVSITLAANKIYNIRKRVPAVVGLEAVSLGLSSGTRWANMNLGAWGVLSYGQFFAWGETQDYGVMSGHTFSWNNYLWSKNGSSTEFFRYNSQDNIKTLMLEYDDAAWAKWGALWRMPTKDEMDELIDQTTQQVVANYESSSIAGVKFISKEDASKHIFLSFGGYMDATVNERDHRGYYWTSTLGDDVANAQYLYMYEGGSTYTSSVARYLGISIRPVYIRKELVAVDLGLPSGTKWANMNIGAEEASQYGQMFAWGETTGYSSSTDYSDHSFNWDNYIWNPSHDGQTFTKYTKDPQSPGDGKDRLEPEDDAAAAIWGGPWLMPTKADFTELIAGTTQSWVANYNGTGVSGMKFVSKAAGNSNYIFLPAVGARVDDSSYGAGTEGYYWSSSLSDGAQQGRGLWFNSSDDSSISSFQIIRSRGLSIRPVIRISAGAGVEDYDKEGSQTWK